jgi:hypothetical protein
VLPADLTCTSFVLDSITYSIGAAIPQSCLFKASTGQFLDAFASAGYSSDDHALGGLVVASNIPYQIQSAGAALTNSYAVVRYWRSYTADGLDIL